MRDDPDGGFEQAYTRTFARVYNEHWTAFAQRISREICDFFAGDSQTATAPRTVLDLCCGTGQSASEFLSRGYQVTGIDLSPHMLEYAITNNREAVDAGKARFLVGDASAFQLERQVNFIVSIFDALNHLPDATALGSCFKSVWASLATPGLFVFDLNTPAAFLLRWNGTRLQDTEGLTLFRTSIYASGSARAYTSITGFVQNADGLYERFTQKVYETVFEIEEVLALLSSTGFVDVHMATAADLAEPTSEVDELDRVFFVCRKELRETSGHSS